MSLTTTCEMSLVSSFHVQSVFQALMSCTNKANVEQSVGGTAGI